MILPRVEVYLVNCIFPTRVNDRYIQPECEPGLEVDAASRAAFTVGEIRLPETANA